MSSGRPSDNLPTVGVEEEFLLVDPDTGEPAPRNRAVAVEAERRGVELQLELSSCQVETTSPVVDSAGELREQLTRLRRTAAEAAEAAGVRLLALGLPPVTPHEFPVTDTPRYRRIGERFGMVAHEQGICGCHVHVQVPDRAAAVHAGNWLRPWLPTLLALSANSAIYRNADTGYASWRSVLWRRWPVAGAPPYFDSPDDYDRTVRMFVDSGVLLDAGMVYWDVRPSADFPTVEVRVADVPATVAETVLLATLIRAAVMTAVDERDRAVVQPPPGVLRAAYWKAAHDGLDGNTLDLVAGQGAVPTRDQLAALVRRVRPALDALDAYGQVVDELDRLSRDGNGAMRQLRAWRRRQEVMDVVEQATATTVS
ncbi:MULTISPECIES: glutamate--cysteine ligase 2 [Mycobacterium]|uniref:Putative glutamate--cysteine ligase 2 n=1 Tax=Mycobacterium kiyosense TaxID=2871094 RepID=A0A9P3UWQ6_9MYCO|nr:MULTISPECIES: glutamate--cysteine ligase [Mycobacterium]BDB43282.1 putative glutamate--cysteine ligase 2-3 [Mycobacterium kiyosense]BDE13520.1 putative glutamate--cysteine ligase 2-3 [Mycobacterium sp. 20KCMC460]GLB84142.1 putative glutamate--cysteine ligase 2-3 [Mycobacterium kiyosense]GLB88453.1 putative glutamate--cysteine ligase 2-3 [Mycobacterium kiyosense]GLB94622.1 putative glutamate--cysteine ligase 2-3 [Mycobacterium kiyosense]